ncbi:MAG: ROK family protein [Acidobacteriia bacterium]|nr:ROK family protein [Terriglobia bacterium]
MTSTKEILAGIDIGGTKTAVLISAQPPEAITRVEFPTRPAKGPQHAIGLIKKSLHEMLAAQGLTAASIIRLGVSCGGPLDRVKGLIQSPPNLPTWDDVPLKAILEEEFQVECLIENDANAGAVAEHRFGAGQGCQNIVFLTMGTGLGAGIIADGRLYRGTIDLAGEIGHVRLTRSGPIGHNKAGSAEGWASGGGMAQLAAQSVAEAQRKDKKTLLAEHVRTGKPISAREVGAAARKGDAVAIEILRSTGERLGEVLAILVDVLNPERIVLGGLAMRLGDLLLDPARRVMRREALAQSARVCAVVPAALGESIGDVAALAVAMGI